MSNSDPNSGPPEQSSDHPLRILKRLNPPLETRVAIRAAVAEELSQRCERIRLQQLPFYRRTVAVPWPIAAAVLVMLAALSIISARSHIVPPEVTYHQSTEVDRAVPESLDDTPETMPVTQSLALFKSTTYFCGFGPMHSETHYVLERPVQ